VRRSSYEWASRVWLATGTVRAGSTPGTGIGLPCTWYLVYKVPTHCVCEKVCIVIYASSTGSAKQNHVVVVRQVRRCVYSHRCRIHAEHIYVFGSVWKCSKITINMWFVKTAVRMSTMDITRNVAGGWTCSDGQVQSDGHVSLSELQMLQWIVHTGLMRVGYPADTTCRPAVSYNGPASLQYGL
jgi:hypothetical protein